MSDARMSGAVYVQTNEPDNAVIAFRRTADGTLERLGTHPTGGSGTEGRSFFLAEGRTEGRVRVRLRGANAPRRRVDGTLTPDFHGVLETADGATILFAWRDSPA